MWEKFSSFLGSDLFFYICTAISFCALIALIILKIIVCIYSRKGLKKWCSLLDKYGIDDDFDAPNYVWQHIDHLVWLCEEYKLDSLYEAQCKFDELYTTHWKYFPDAFRQGEAVERNNRIENEEDKQ